MKTKFYLVLAVMILSWMGCSQEEAIDELKGGANVIYATIEGASRSTVTDAGKFSWAEGDAIMLLDGSNHKDTYTYSGTGDGFNPPSSGSVTNPVVAYYPANENHSASTFDLPSEYGGENTAYVANTNAAMIATPPATGNTFAFMHLGGVMRFNVKDVPAGANKFTFTSTNKMITGSFDIKESNGVKIIETQTVQQENSVSISFQALTAVQDMTFYVPLPVGSYEKYKITISDDTYDGTGSSSPFELSQTTNTLNDGANTIARGTLLLMPTFTCNLNGNKLEKGDGKVNVIKLQDNSVTSISNDAEVFVTPGDNADAVATLHYTPEQDNSSTLSISDGSTENTASAESKGKVVVNTTTSNSTIASCEINAPTLTVELSAENNADVTYTEVTALTAQQTLIIGKGVTVTTLKLKGGNVIIEDGATVGTIENAEGFNGKTCVVKKGALTNEQIPANIIFVSNESEMALHVAAENGGDVTLTDDIELLTPIIVASEKTVTLDLNGKTISQTSTTPVSMITNNGNLTIKDSSNDSGKIAFTFNGTVNNGVAANAISNRGTMVVEGGEISNTGTGNQIGYAIDNYNGSTLTVDGGKISASGSSYYDGIRLFCGSNETTVTVNSGEISSIWAQNPSADKATEVRGTVIINGGTVGTTYYEDFTTVKVKNGVSTTVTAYGEGQGSATSESEGDYTKYYFVHE